jgi:hypothetical protein
LSPGALHITADDASGVGVDAVDDHLNRRPCAAAQLTTEVGAQVDDAVYLAGHHRRLGTRHVHHLGEPEVVVVA